MNLRCQIHARATLTLQEEPSLPTKQEAWWASEPLWTFRRREISLACAGIRAPGRQAQYRIRETLLLVNSKLRSIPRPVIFCLLHQDMSQ
jgi:hypothetical protein